jgi:CDP-diglyceride synthetase
MVDNPLLHAKINAILACIYLGVLHYSLILLLLSANFTQDISFLPILFAFLAGSHATIGFVSGYVAKYRQYGTIASVAATVVGFLAGVFSAFAVVVILSSLFPGAHRPIVDHMIAYVVTLAAIGSCVSFICVTLFSIIRRSFG